MFSNRAARFIAAISYNLYIWHQWLAVQLKQWRIPYWAGETPPNMTGDLSWQWRYTLLLLALSFGAAIVLTYCFERPAARLLLGTGRPSGARGQNTDGGILMHYECTPRGVCASHLSFDIEDGKLQNVVFTGGCNGNLKAIGLLVEGRDAAEVAGTLRGNRCGHKPTSCADQPRAGHRAGRRRALTGRASPGAPRGRPGPFGLPRGRRGPGPGRQISLFTNAAGRDRMNHL